MPPLSPELLALWSGGVWEPCAPSAIKGVSNDTRTIPPGALYVALHGERFDGHAFVDDAFAKGAAGAMVDPSSPLQGRAARPLLRVRNTTESLGLMAKAYRRSVNPVTVGITGSVGKSTVKEMAASILAETMPTAKTLGNWNNDIGLPLSLLAMAPDSRAGVFEVGMNHPGEIARLCDLLEPQWGVVTAIGPVHIAHFQSVADIAAEKAALLRALPADGRAVLCHDDPYFEILRACVPCPFLTVSLTGAADYVVDSPRGSGTLTIREASSRETRTIAWSWPGRHNAINAAYAIAVARGMGAGWDAITRGLACYRPLPMRWQLGEAHGIQIVNDAYNANPLSMRASLRAFEDVPVSGAKWLVLGSMLELGVHALSEHVSLGEFVAAGGPWAGLVVVGSPGEKIATGARSRGFDASRIWACESNAEVISVLQREMHSGDAVFLKASRGVALEEVANGLKGC